MRTVPAPPYLLPPDEAVVAEEWLGSDGAPVGERLDHWDSFTDLELTQIVNVDVSLIRDACQLGRDSAVAATASWVSSRTRLSADGSTVEIGTLDGRVRLPLSVTIPGAIAG